MYHISASANSVANSAVSGLSEFLRYTLDQDPMKKVTVAQEMVALNLYLNIEKMRFGPRLTIEHLIEDEASDVLMRRLTDHHTSRLRHLLESRSQVGRVPDGGVIHA